MTIAPAVTDEAAAGAGGAVASHEEPTVPADGAVTGAADGDVAGALAAAPAATPATDDPAHDCAGVGIVAVVGGGGVAGAGVEVAGAGVEVAGAGVEVAGAGVEVAGAGVAGGLAVVVEPAIGGGLLLAGVVLPPDAGGVTAVADESVAVVPLASVGVVTDPFEAADVAVIVPTAAVADPANHTPASRTRTAVSRWTRRCPDRPVRLSRAGGRMRSSVIVYPNLTVRVTMCRWPAPSSAAKRRRSARALMPSSRSPKRSLIRLCGWVICDSVSWNVATRVSRWP